ncbi:MAG: sigma-54-dependent Fis family transcriptional regulator [Deltaproteobacteria bacterium]|nr:sigma-54-dependent Fis family transcriptional regulator [Deltaproteobacteria bacterium]
MKEQFQISDIIGETRGIKLARRLVTQASKTETPVLLQGENGTGKGLISKIIHHNSSRSNKPLVTLNCAGCNEETLQQELFCEDEEFRNVFQRAEGGTLYLQEIDAIPLSLQIQLLNRIKKDPFRNSSSITRMIHQARLITSTEKDLEKLIRKKKFREDLYYQLNVIQIYLPPLRKRIKDFPILAEYFLNQACAGLGKAPPKISDDLYPTLRSYEWIGNIQEFANAIEFAANIVPEGGEITPEDLPEHIINAKGYDIANEILFPQKGIDLKNAVKKFERNLILQALDQADGIISNAAEILHVKRTTLVEKIKREKINSERFKKRRRLRKTLKKRKIF